MNLPWFRFYAEFSSDPVVQSLAFEDQRHYVVILCLKCAGVIDRNISATSKRRIILRALGLDSVSGDEAQRRLMEVGLISKNWQPKGWDKRQFQSDLSTQRVRKSRKNKETGNVSETLPERSRNGPDTEQIQNIQEDSLRESCSSPQSLTLEDQEGSNKRELVPEDGKPVKPDWLPQKALDDFRAHRRKLKAPMTDEAESRLFAKLARLRAAGDDPVAVIDESIVNGWRGVFPLKHGHAQSQQDAHRARAQQENERFVSGGNLRWGT